MSESYYEKIMALRMGCGFPEPALRIAGQIAAEADQEIERIASERDELYKRLNSPANTVTDNSAVIERLERQMDELRRERNTLEDTVSHLQSRLVSEAEWRKEADEGWYRMNEELAITKRKLNDCVEAVAGLVDGMDNGDGYLYDVRGIAEYIREHSGDIGSGER